jgi:hypothetical protein
MELTCFVSLNYKFFLIFEENTGKEWKEHSQSPVFPYTFTGRVW